MKVSIINLGCKVNRYESDSLEEEFKENGFEIAKKSFDSDIVVVNTCTVTNIADRKSRQMIRRAKKNGSIVVCTGCLADIQDKKIYDNNKNNRRKQNEKEKEKENENYGDKSYYDDIDIMVTNDKKVKLVDIVISYLNGEDISNIIYENENYKDNGNNDANNYGEFKGISYQDKTRAVLKIQDGCNMFCSYCIIPYVRGRIRSRKKENVLKEAKKIAENGIKEIVLTGIHVASYGKDNIKNSGNNNGKKEEIEEKEYFLIDLLEDLNKVEGIERIRISSIEPNIITDEFLDRLAKLDKICHHFHLSMQSASNYILKKMNRKYTIEEYMKKVQMLREKFEDVLITTDIITGFPFETDEYFKETYDNVEKIHFLRTHVFPYSERKGTLASRMGNSVDISIRKKRANEMIELSSKNNLETLKKLKENNNYNNGFSVLIEELKDGKYYGYSRNYVRCVISKEDLEKHRNENDNIVTGNSNSNNSEEGNIENKEEEKEKEVKNFSIINLKNNIKYDNNYKEKNNDNNNNKNNLNEKDEYIGNIYNLNAKEVIEVKGNIVEYVMECN